jgi:hypothetical protein
MPAHRDLRKIKRAAVRVFVDAVVVIALSAVFFAVNQWDFEAQSRMEAHQWER